jgi:N-acetylglucosaminyldiphosphoundecaprenol N-acetyl-beta-D-mannosaminyltransferase
VFLNPILVKPDRAADLRDTAYTLMNTTMPVPGSPQDAASPSGDDGRMRCDIAGIPFDFVVATEVAGMIDTWRRSGVRNYISITNAHSVMVCRRDAEMRQATTHAALTLPDSIGIVLAAMILGYGRYQRTTGPELMLRICDQGREYGLRHFFFGGGAGVAERLALRLSERFPGLAVAGTYAPPFRYLDAAEDQAVVDRINVSRADVLWVGLGAPKQEKWIAGHAGQIQATTMIGVGAAFDFHSGKVKWAPTWMRRMGLEWIHRLVLNPKRMWRRNLDSPLFVGLVCWQRMRMALYGQGAMPECGAAATSAPGTTNTNRDSRPDGGVARDLHHTAR